MRRYTLLLAALLAAVLQISAAAAELPDDGIYHIEAQLTGGSGKAAVNNPVELTVRDGAATAVLVWSSPHYEWMLLNGVTYYPVGTDGGSAFAVPVVLDADMPVTAQTIAMSEPHQIDYTLYLDSSTLAPYREKRSGWVYAVTAFLLLLAAGGGAAYYQTHKRKRRPRAGRRL